MTGNEARAQLKIALKERDQARLIAERLADGGNPEPLPWLPCGAGVYIGHNHKLYTCGLPEGHEGHHRISPEDS